MRKALVWFSCLALLGAMFMVVGCDDSDSTYVSGPPPVDTEITTKIDTATLVATDGVLNGGTVTTKGAAGDADDTVVSITVEKGTIAYTAKGNAVGQISATLVASDAGVKDTFFKGSFEVKEPDGKTSKYVTLGAARIELKDANGDPITALSKPLMITVAIPEGTKNPRTNVAYKEGDQVPIYAWGEKQLFFLGYATAKKGSIVVTIPAAWFTSVSGVSVDQLLQAINSAATAAGFTYVPALTMETFAARFIGHSIGVNNVGPVINLSLTTP